MIAGLGVLALAIAVLGFATLYGDSKTSTVQAAGISLGVDVTTGGNTASALGTIDTCRRVEVGDTFDVDLVIANVDGLRAWELYFGFDGSLLQLTGQNTAYMVSGFDASDPVPDSTGRHFLAIGGTQAASGSGVLARLTFRAMATGVSNVAVVYNPVWPRLTAASGPLGDTTGDSYFDGPVSAARIAIGQDCPSTPVVTDTPGPTVTAPPSPSPTPSAVPSLTPTPTSGPPIVGDADCSGRVDLPDVMAALKYAAHLGLSSECQSRADVDCDRFVTASDVLRILRYLTGDAIPQPTQCASIGSPILG